MDKNKQTQELSIEELRTKVVSQEAHIRQLKNLLQKHQNPEKDCFKKKHAKQRPFDFNKYNTRHVALKFFYLGWDMHGFAVQEDTEKTVEAVLFDTLTKTKLIEKRENSNYHRCGRTDKGVSAFSQVVSIDLRSNLLEGVGVKQREGGTAEQRPGDKTIEIDYVRILNQVLPDEIRVTAWAPVDPDFSARFSCLRRTYKYYFPQGGLDINAMRSAAQKLHGEHDFRNFCKMDVGNGVVNYMRNILFTDVTVVQNATPEGYTMCELTVVGAAFLWHQIRCIVAILIVVGQGKERTEIIEELLDVEKNPQKPQYSMASELPLVLFDCQYEDIDWIYSQDRHVETLQHLQAQWTKHSVRATMVRRMLDHLEMSVTLTSQPECLLPGNKSRTYKPLLQRQRCESLEKRIDHFVKRRRIADPRGEASGSPTPLVIVPIAEGDDNRDSTAPASACQNVTAGIANQDTAYISSQAAGDVTNQGTPFIPNHATNYLTNQGPVDAANQNL